MCWSAWRRERNEAIKDTNWSRSWVPRELKPRYPRGRCRVPDGRLHASRYGLIGKQYLCGRSAAGRKMAEAWGVVLGISRLCRRCLKIVLAERGVEI